MAEPFVFHFRRGDTGPEQMYLADIRAECGVCRHVQVQRYYHATPLHPVTVSTLRQLAGTVARKTAFDCPNCGTPVGPEHALSTAFTWAFADDAGLIRGFVTDAQDPHVRWQFVQQRRLDPQELPGWEASPSFDTFDTLDDERIEQALGRPLNPKAVIREVLQDWLDDPDGGAIATIGPHMTLFAGAGPKSDAISLADCVPLGLPTHRAPEGLAGRLEGWLPPVDRRRVAIAVDPAPAIDVVERAFAVANITAERTDSGWENLTTPRDAPYPRDLGLDAILRRAVYTGLTPGDAARLTVEEIVGTLLRVW